MNFKSAHGRAVLLVAWLLLATFAGHSYSFSDRLGNWAGDGAGGSIPGRTLTGLLDSVAGSDTLNVSLPPLFDNRLSAIDSEFNSSALNVHGAPVHDAAGNLTYDGNHFNDAGHRFVAEQMLKMFK